MIDENTIGAIQEALAPVAAKIGEGTAYAWNALVLGQFAEGLATLIAIALVGLITIVPFVIHIKKVDFNSDDVDSSGLIAILSGIGSLFWFVISSIVLTEAIIKVIAPEYAAIKFLLTLAGG